MASGSYTGWQHTLLDMKELTKENFLDFCDKAFYHLDRFGFKDTEEMKKFKEKQVQDAIDQLETWERKYEDFLKHEMEKNIELAMEYVAYVKQTEDSNRKNRETYKQEVERMNTLREWVVEFPQLDYIWKGFEEPNLYQTKVKTIEEWVKEKKESLEHNIKFYQGQVEKMKKLADEDRDVVEKYEEQKRKFLER